MAKLKELIVASFECPSCHTQVEVYANFGISTEPQHLSDKTIGVKLSIQGIRVSHDCRPKPTS